MLAFGYLLYIYHHFPELAEQGPLGALSNQSILEEGSSHRQRDITMPLCKDFPIDFNPPALAK